MLSLALLSHAVQSFPSWTGIISHSHPQCLKVCRIRCLVSEELKTKNWKNERGGNIGTIWGSWDTQRHHTCRHTSTDAFLLNGDQAGVLLSHRESCQSVVLWLQFEEAWANRSAFTYTVCKKHKIILTPPFVSASLWLVTHNNNIYIWLLKALKLSVLLALCRTWHKASK